MAVYIENGNVVDDNTDEVVAERVTCNEGTFANCGPAVVAKRNELGDIFCACAAHERYLAGWINDADSESRSDSMASRRYEDAAYGFGE